MKATKIARRLEYNSYEESLSWVCSASIREGYGETLSLNIDWTIIRKNEIVFTKDCSDKTSGNSFKLKEDIFIYI